MPRCERHVSRLWVRTTATRSPRVTPRWSSALATRFDSREISPNAYGREEPSAATATSAGAADGCASEQAAPMLKCAGISHRWPATSASYSRSAMRASTRSATVDRRAARSYGQTRRSRPGALGGFLQQAVRAQGDVEIECAVRRREVGAEQRAEPLEAVVERVDVDVQRERRPRRAAPVVEVRRQRPQQLLLRRSAEREERAQDVGCELAEVRLAALAEEQGEHARGG